MKTKITAEPKKELVSVKVLEQKWSKQLIASGFTALPNVIFQYQKALKLKPLDVVILLNLASFWWEAENHPFPAKTTIADYMNIDPRTVQRSIKKMEDMGYVKRIERFTPQGDNKSNAYDLSGLIAAAQPLAKEKLEAIAKRKAEDKQKVVTPKVFELIKGGK